MSAHDAPSTSIAFTLGRAAVRRHRMEDAAELARHANDARIADQLRDAFPHPYTLADAERFISLLEAQALPTAYLVTVDGIPCGGIGYLPQGDIERVGAEVGYWLAPAYWGQGIMSGLLATFSRAVFAQVPELRRLQGLTFADNAASRRVLEKAGYRLEATLHEAAIKHGRVRDQVLYALLRRDLEHP